MIIKIIEENRKYDACQIYHTKREIRFSIRWFKSEIDSEKEIENDSKK